MLRLQKRGCHNINLVTPTHFVPHILEALAQAARGGLRLPVVYNTNGYDSLLTLELLDGVVDVYLPDAKYSSDEVAGHLSGFRHYVQTNRQALMKMAEQVGTKLVVDERGIAHRGIIVRHLILPNGLAGTDKVLPWIAGHVGCDVYISLMNQYFPAHHALDDPQLSRKITDNEHLTAWRILEECGLENGWVQEHANQLGEGQEVCS
jgi:putative pyruvate formate lyase activating enzyme